RSAPAPAACTAASSIESEARHKWDECLGGLTNFRRHLLRACSVAAETFPSLMLRVAPALHHLRRGRAGPANRKGRDWAAPTAVCGAGNRWRRHDAGRCQFGVVLLPA